MHAAGWGSLHPSVAAGRKADHQFSAGGTLPLQAGSVPRWATLIDPFPHTELPLGEPRGFLWWKTDPRTFQPQGHRELNPSQHKEEENP